MADNGWKDIISNTKNTDRGWKGLGYASKNKGGFGAGVGYTLGKLGTGALGIGEGIWDYTAGGLAKLFGADDWAEEQFANNVTGNLNSGLDDWYNPSKGWQVAGDVAGGIGNSLVGVAVVAGASFVSGGTLTAPVAAAIAGGTIGLGAAGMSTSEAYNKTGELGAKEFGYGAISGVTEAALESVTGVAGKVGGKLFAKTTAKNIAKKSVLKGVVSSFAGEAFEEGMSEFLDPYFQRWTKVDPEAKNATAQEIGYAALIGGISGALMGGFGDSYSAVRAINRGSQIEKSGNANTVVELSREFAQYQDENSSNIEAYRYIEGLVSQYDSIAAKNLSDKPTIAQRRILGEMERANTVLAYAPAVNESKARILADADSFVEYLNSQNLEMEDGSIFKITTEELLNNEALLTRYAVSDALGHIMMDSQSAYDLTMQGDVDTLQNKWIGGERAFLRLKENASELEIKEMSSLLGIDINTVTYEEYIERLKSIPSSSFIEHRDTLATMKTAQQAIGEAKVKRTEVAEITRRSAIHEGINLFVNADGKMFAIIKHGKDLQLYMDGKITKKLTKKELIAFIFGDKVTEQQPKTQPEAPEAAKPTQEETVKPTENTEKDTESSAESNDNAVLAAAAEESEPVQVETSDQDTNTTADEETAPEPPQAPEKPKAVEKPKPPKAVKKTSKFEARRRLVQLTLRKSAGVHGAYVLNGKQIITDGYFGCIFDEVVEGLTENEGNKPNLEATMQKYRTTDSTKIVEIDAAELKKVVPSKITEEKEHIAHLGVGYFQTKMTSLVYEAIENPVCYVSDYTGLYIKGTNGEAVVLGMRNINNGLNDKVKYEAKYAKNHSETMAAFEAAETDELNRRLKEQRERERKDKEWYANERKKAADTIDKAATDLVEGKEVKNSKVKTYKGETDFGSETSVLLALFTKYDISVPLRTQGWINSAVHSVQRVGSGRWQYKLTAKATKSKVATDYIEKLYDTIDKALYPDTNTATDSQAEAATTEETKPKTGKIEDFGEKIGGARKDEWASRGLRADDLADMNEREAAKYVKRDNIWKKPDYVKLVKEGGNRALLYAQNEIRKALKPNIDYFNYTTEERRDAVRKLYIDTIAEIQSMAEKATSAQDFENMGKKWLLEKGYIKEELGKFSWTSAVNGNPVFSNGGYAVYYDNIRRIANRFDSLLRSAEREQFAVSAEDKIPAGYDIHQDRSFTGYTGDDKYYITKGHLIIGDRYATREEAFSALKTIVANKGKTDRKQRFVPPQLKEVHREGLDYRANNTKDVTGDDYLSEFGFRGGEFGNWVSDKERQVCLNYGYDALMDLADALGISKNGISYGGELSVAFGARGKGGSSAVAAHYEPLRKVINLTKMNGAGSLAHEWWHGLDNYLANRYSTGYDTSAGDVYATDIWAKYIGATPTKLEKAVYNLVKTMKFRPETAAEATARANENRARDVARINRYLGNWFSWFEQGSANPDLYKSYGLKESPTTADIAKYKELKEKIITTGDIKYATELDNLHKKLYGKQIPRGKNSGFASDYDIFLMNVEGLSRYKETPQLGERHTDYYTVSKEADKQFQKFGHAYWQSTIEMSARAFASYIKDKTNGKSDYLCAHEYVSPQGEERTRINKAFDELFDILKEEGILQADTSTKPSNTARYAVSEGHLNNEGNAHKQLTRIKREVADSFARKHIKKYDDLSEGRKLEVRWTIASGKMYGIDDNTIISLARLSVDSGISIGFANMDGDGVCYTAGGDTTIYLNPNGERTIETATLHELVHSMKGVEGYDYLETVANDYYNDKDHIEEREELRKKYVEFYNKKGIPFTEEILQDELTAAYIEKRLESRKVLAELAVEEPTFMQKCIDRIKNIKKVFSDSSEAMSDIQLLENKFVSVYNARKAALRSGDSTRFVIKKVSKSDIDINGNMLKVSNMGAVSILNGNEFVLGDKSLYGQVEEFFNSIDNNAYNSVLGDVELKRRGVKDSVGHGIGKEKAAAFKAVPEIIKLGHIIDYQHNWKNKGFDTAVIAAPIKVAGVDYYAGVIVRRSQESQRFYLHELEIIEDTNNEKIPRSTETLVTSNAGDLGEVPSLVSILQKIKNVKPKKNFALDMSKKQDKTSAATSINVSKLPVLYGKVQFESGTVNLDIGGGRFDNVTDYLSTLGVQNYIYDPYNRSAEHNLEAARRTEEGQSDTVTISNVLNVIDTVEGRNQVLENAVDAVKADGTVYITVYEGDGSGVARTTGKDQFQLNKKTADYVSEVQKYFSDVIVRNKVIIAKKPIMKTKDLALPSSDSNGTKLSPQQQEYFKDSKVVDKDGNLLVVYHGTEADFTVFDKNKQAGGWYGKGFYFTDFEQEANDYSRGKQSKPYYLNITNPFIVKNDEIVNGEIVSSGTFLQQVEKRLGKRNLDLNKVNEILQSYGYDGIKASGWYISFNSKQAKLTTNTSPTGNPDTRYAAPSSSSHIDLSQVAGSNLILTEMPTDRVTLRDVVAGGRNIDTLKAQVKGDTKRFTEGFQIMSTNAQAGLERVIKSSGIANAMAMTNYVRAARYAGFNAIHPDGGQYSLDGETRLGDSLAKIWAPIYKGDKLGKRYAKNPEGNARYAHYKDYQKAFETYLAHYHNIDRYAQGKMVLGEDITPIESQKIVNEFEETYPEFRKIAEKTWKFNDNLLNLAVESGQYSQEYVDILRAMYTHYVPTFRAEHNKGIGVIQGRTNIQVNNAKKRAVGADTEILPMDDMIAKMVMQRYSSARVNKLLVDMVDAFNTNGTHSDEFVILHSEAAELDIDTGALVETKKIGDGKYQVSFYYNGKRVTAEVSKNVYSGIEAFAPNGDTSFNNVLLDGVSKVNATFKKLVTSWNPFFSFFRNPIRDIQEAGLYTRYPLRVFAKNYGVARREISTNGKYWQEAKAAGITAASVYDYERGITIKDPHLAKKMTQTLESASNALEMAPRLAEYISAREAGLSVQEALLQAQDVTVNFGRGGTFAKKLNSTIMPFLNPAIQGFSKMVRAYTGKDAAKSWVNLIIRSIMLGIGLTALNDLLNGDDEDYQNLSDYIKENNYVIALGDGDFLKIPKGRVLGVIGSVYLRSKWYLEGDEKAFEGILKNFSTQVTPVDNFSRTIFSPFSDLKNNATWYGGTIESQKWANTQAKDRYDEGTSSISIWLGKVFNYSPIKIDYLLEQYGGVVSDIVLPATTLQAERGIVSQNLLSNSITNSKWSSKFYDTLEEYNYAKTSGSDTAKGVVKYLNSINGTISDMNTQKRSIQADTTLSDAEKLTQVRIIQAAINALEKDALENAKYLETELEKYDLSESNFSTSWRDAVSVVIGEDFALRSYNADVYAKATKLQNGGISMSTFYDYYFDIKKLESDTDADGNTISGSKKAKVVEYTLSTDIPNVQKLVLLMSNGYTITDNDIQGLKAKDAKIAVAKYIAKLNVSSKEKIEIAEMCGYTVKNGKIILK